MPRATDDLVMIYLPHLRTGGGEMSMLQLAQGFISAGRRVQLVVHTRRQQELAVPPGVVLTDLNRSGTAGAWWELVQLLRQRRPRWLLSAFPHTNVAAVAACAVARCGSQVVLTDHAPVSLQIAQQLGPHTAYRHSLRWRMLPGLMRWAYPRAAAVVAVSEGVRADLCQLTGRSLETTVIGNPVLGPGFEAAAALPPSHPWLLDRQLRVVLGLSRLAPEKDLPTLLRAFAEVHRARPETRLLLAGEGQERARLQALVDDLGLGAAVRMPGRTAEPLSWMRHAAVFVLASRFEGFGNVLIEALACQTPVVATDCPVGPRDVLQGGRFGSLVPVGDASAMARAVLLALDHPTLPAGAHESALAYTQANAAAAYLRLLDRLAARAERAVAPC